MKISDYTPAPKTAIKTGLIVIGALLAYQLMARPVAEKALRQVGLNGSANRIAA